MARVVPRLAPRCRHWITVNEPNIVALMGWVDGSCPPGRRGAVADAWAVADNLLTAHVLAYSAIHAVQPEAQVTTNTSTSTIYDYDRMMVDLLTVRGHGVRREDLDAWLGERRAAHDAGSPPPGTADRVLRGLFAAASPYGPAWAGRLRRPSPRRVVDAVYEAPGDRLLDAVGMDWYDPVAGHALRLPGHRTAGGRSWEPGRAIWDVVADPEGLTSWCRGQHGMTPDVPLWVVENGMATRFRNGRGFHRLDGWDRPRYLRAHVGAVVDAVAAGAPVAAYLHWSLVDNYEWGTYEPRFGIFGVDRDRWGDGVRWLDTDADGADSAGAFRRLVDGVRAGDRSVLAAD